MLLNEFYGMFQVGNASSFGSVVSGGYKVIDCNLVFAEEGMDMGFVENASSLGLREDEVEEEAEANPGIEGDPEAQKIVNYSCDVNIKGQDV
jgi:hypothetical protein